MATNQDSNLIQTANGYLLCPAHAQAWRTGGNDVAMWPATQSDLDFAADEFGSAECVDCTDAAAQLTVDEAGHMAAVEAWRIATEIGAEIGDWSDVHGLVDANEITADYVERVAPGLHGDEYVALCNAITEVADRLIRDRAGARS